MAVFDLFLCNGGRCWKRSVPCYCVEEGLDEELSFLTG